MQMTRIDDLAFGIDGDYIDLEQDAGCGEMSMIRLHRIHLAHLAEVAGVVTTDRCAEQSIRTLQRRLLTLAREIHSLAEWVRSGPDEGEAGFPDFLQVMALETLAQALIDDLPGGAAINLIEGRNQFNCHSEPTAQATAPNGGNSGAAPTTGQLFPADAKEVSCN